MGLLPDTLSCGLRMRRECRERFPRHRLQREPPVSDPGTHHGTCVKHEPWCMSGSLTRGGGENVPGIRGACATRNITYLIRGPWGRYPQHCPFVRETTAPLYIPFTKVPVMLDVYAFFLVSLNKLLRKSQRAVGELGQHGVHVTSTFRCLWRCNFDISVYIRVRANLFRDVFHSFPILTLVI